MLTKFSVKKPFTVLVAVVITIMFGAVAFTKMTPDLFPKVDLPYVAVVTAYPGASPQEVEKTITAPMEQQLSSLENLKTMTSTSQKNASIILLEFEQEANLDTVSVDIRDKVDLSSKDWNEMVQKSVILKMNPSMIPITVSAVSQKGKSIEETSKLLEDGLLRKLEGVEGVASVSTTGMIDSTVHISIDSKKVDEINKKIQDGISAGFKDAENQINSQVISANKGLSELKKAKENIKASQDALIEQGSNLKSVISTLKTLNATKEGLVLANGVIRENVASQMPGATQAQIEAACMQNPIYARNIESIKQADQGISSIIKELRPISAQLKAFGIDINKLNTLDGVIAAESSLNKNLADAGNKLSNGMSEVTGNSALLNAANLQLKASLAQMAMQAESATSAANPYNYLTVDGISGLITTQNFEMPAGYISDDKKDVLVTIGDKFTSIDDLENMILFDMGMSGIEPIRLGQVTNITYVSNGADRYSKINGEDSIMLVFSKQSDYSTTEVADNIQAKFAELEGEQDGLSFDTLSNQGDYIKMAISSVLQSLLIGGILAIFILIFFLRDIKPTFITACSIPISITFAVVLMYFSGISLNIVSLAGLAVGIGMLVDNSIVVVENIYRLRAMGYSRVKASISGAAQVAGAITASTLTTICVFAPIIFIEGVTKVILRDMALTVTYSLLASLIIALTIVPSLASLMLKNVNQKTVLNKESKIISNYKKAVAKVLNHKVIVLALAVVLLISSIGLSLLKGLEYMPSMSSPQLSATLIMPEGSSQDDSVRISDEIAQEIEKMDGVDTVGVMLSSSRNSMMGIDVQNSDFSSMAFYILLKEDQTEKGKTISEKIQKLAEEKGCEAQVSDSVNMSAMTGGSGISINVESDNLEELRTSTMMIEKVLGNTKGISDVSNIDENSTDEIKLIIDREKAMSYGLTVAQVYAQVAEKISSEKKATKINYDGGSRDVIVSAKSSEKINEQQLLDLDIRGSGNAASETVKLSELAEVSRGKALDAISRIDQKRGQTITAAVDDGYNITKQTDKVKTEVEKLDLPEGVRVEFKGEDEQITEAMEQLMLLFGLGILLVYLIMVAQFQSLLMPFIIMFTVPLAITGAFVGLLVTGFELSVVSMIGIIMLLGIIVNNAIVLVSYINTIRLDGMDKKSAIIEAGAVRMRPVLMTAITTILGLLPMAIGTGSGSEMMQPIAIVCIGGILYGTITTLFIIPIMYDMFAKKNMRKISEDELTITTA